MCYIVRLSGPITRDICMYSQRNPAEIAFNPHASTRTDRHVTSLSRAMTRSWRQFLVYIGSRSSKSVGARMMMPNVPTKVTVVNSQKINRSSTIDTNCQSCFTCVQRYLTYTDIIYHSALRQNIIHVTYCAVFYFIAIFNAFTIHYAAVTCEIKLFQSYFSLRRRPTEIGLFQHVETCVKLFQFQKLIAGHGYFFEHVQCRWSSFEITPYLQ